MSVPFQSQIGPGRVWAEVASRVLAETLPRTRIQKEPMKGNPRKTTAKRPILVPLTVVGGLNCRIQV